MATVLKLKMRSKAMRNLLQIASSSFVFKLPLGLENYVGEGGIGLSEG